MIAFIVDDKAFMLVASLSASGSNYTHIDPVRTGRLIGKTPYQIGAYRSCSHYRNIFKLHNYYLFSVFSNTLSLYYSDSLSFIMVCGITDTPYGIRIQSSF